MSSWCPQEYASGSWMCDYRYEGPGSTQTGHEFILHATLDPGAERYFSGLRILIGCKNTQELSTLEINDNLDLNARSCDGRDTKLEKMKLSLLEAQEYGCEHAMHWTDSDSCATVSLPLCRMVFEVVNKNTKLNQVDIVLHPPEATESQSLRTLYDYVLLCTPTSRSCILFLKTNHNFPVNLNRDDKFRMMPSPASMGVLTHGVRILPPSTSRQPFIILPDELLRMIFREAMKTEIRSNWRKTMISLALVCRAWSPALDNMYEVFAQYNTGSVPPSAIQLATTVEMNPDLGKKIRVFDHNHFRAMESSEASFLQHGKAIIEVLKTATRVKDLSVFYTHRTLAQAFVQALWSSSEVRVFCVNRRGHGRLINPNYVYLLSVGNIIQCMSHWPSVQKLIIHHFFSTIDSDDLPMPTCSIQSVFLQHGYIMLPQLRSLTTSWKSALREATLQHISGLTNNDVHSWLFEVGPTLTSLSIEYSPLSRRPDEEYAVDAVMPAMVNLSSLNLEGDIVSELTLLRYVAPNLEESKVSRRQWIGLWIDNAPGLSAHGFLVALKATAWTSISVRTPVVREENIELSEEAKRIAKRRNIKLMM